jgi:hypothetical protein
MFYSSNRIIKGSLGKESFMRETPKKELLHASITGSLAKKVKVAAVLNDMSVKQYVTYAVERELEIDKKFNELKGL